MNKTTPPNLTKSCTNCGQQKPLSAFLEMSGTHGTAYGNVCSSCRKTAMEAAERRKKTEAEGSTTSETGHKIDSKTKVHDAIDKREKFHQIEEDYHKERELKKEATEEVIEKKQLTAQKEKKHRHEFLDKRRENPVDKKADAVRSANKAHSAETVARNTQQIEANANQAMGAHDERKKTKHDFSIPYQGQQIAGQIRFSGQIFQQFRQWLGNAAPVVNNVNVTQKQAAPKQAGAITQSVNQIRDSVVSAKKGEASPDPAIELIEKNWRPGSKK